MLTSKIAAVVSTWCVRDTTKDESSDTHFYCELESRILVFFIYIKKRFPFIIIETPLVLEPNFA